MNPLEKNRSGDTSLGGGPGDFPKTAWDVLSQAADSSSPTARAGLEELFRQYWKPVYRYLRVGWARSNEDAKDLTQAFFLRFVEEDLLSRYDRERAAFRTYLKSLLKHFVQDHDKAAHRLKRGGGVRLLALDGDENPASRAIADPNSHDPERAFDRAWLGVLIGQSVDRVRDRLRLDGREKQFQVFEAYSLAPPPERPTYAVLAERLGLKEGDIKNHLFSVREELRKEIRRELSRTSGSAQEFEEEWNAFFGS